MSKSRRLNAGSILHPRHERPRQSAGGMVDKVGVSTGGHSVSRSAGPARRQGSLAIHDGPARGGVVVSPIDTPEDGSLTPAGRFRVTK